MHHNSAAMQPTGENGRRRLPADERRGEIVAAVLELASDRGPDAITTQAIADRIGVTQAALFRHFPDKQAIWLAVFDWIAASLGVAVAGALSAPGAPLEKLERAFLAHVAFLAAHPGVPRVLYHELQYPGDSPVRVAVRAMITRYRRRLASLLRDAKRSGDIAPDVDASLASLLFIGAVQGLVVDAALAGDPAFMNRRAPRAFRLLVDGFRGLLRKR